MYNLNTKVNWEQLAPSLQAKFNFINKILDQRKRILDSNGNILNNNAYAGYQLDKLTWLKEEFDRNIDKYLLEIDRKQLPDIESTKDDGGLDSSMFTSALTGQVAKIKNSNSIFGSDFLYNLRVTSNQAEFDYMVSSAPFIDLQDVFNNWYRFAHSDNNALHVISDYGPEHSYGTWQSSTTWCNGWQYNPTNRSIIQRDDLGPITAFINQYDKYYNYYLRVGANFTDNDGVLIFVGYMKDSRGIEHTLSIYRGTEGGDSNKSWMFAYDIGNPTQHFIVDYTDRLNDQVWDGVRIFSAKREGDYLEFKTPAVNETEDVESWTIRWTYPSSKPSDMTAEEYYNIGVMLHSTNRVGVGSFGMKTEFYIIDQEYVFEDSNIYRLDRNEVWTKNNDGGSWYNSGKRCSDVLQPYIYLYNSYLDTLYFYGSLPSSINGSENGYDWMKITPGKLNHYSEGSGR